VLIGILASYLVIDSLQFLFFVYAFKARGFGESLFRLPEILEFVERQRLVI
jgi:hypothetical protein